MLAGKKFGIPVKGTHAHAFVSSFHADEEVGQFKLLNKNTNKNELLYSAVEKRLVEVTKELGVSSDQVNKGELKAFTAYANAFPSSFLALIDTYDALK